MAINLHTSAVGRKPLKFNGRNECAVGGSVLGHYGTFITVAVNFVIIAFVLFLLIRGMNRMIKKEEAAPPPPAPPSKEVALLTEIRDLLKARG